MAVYNFGTMVNLLKKNPKKIVFTEGTDVRILEAASRLLASNFLTPVLIGKPDEIEKIAEDEGYNIRGAEIIDTPGFSSFDTDELGLALKERLPETFLDFAPYLDGCRFVGCSHTKEKGCAVHRHSPLCLLGPLVRRAHLQHAFR